MADPITGLVAVVMSLGLAPTIIYLRSRHKLKERQLELEAGKSDDEETKRLADENKLLRERVENLESIVCSVDFELNQNPRRDPEQVTARQLGRTATWNERCRRPSRHVVGQRQQACPRATSTITTTSSWRVQTELHAHPAHVRGANR